MSHLFVVLLLFTVSNSLAQHVDWISFENLNEKMRAQPRPILIFIHTSWCKFCALQEENTFKDSVISKQINKNFYAISLDAEEKKPIIFLNRYYQHKPSGSGTGYHELAEILGKQNGMLSFPTTVILSPSLQITTRVTGFVNTQDLQRLLEH